MNWKPNADDKRRLRKVAAEDAGLGLMQIALRPALRHPVHFEGEPSFNDWLWGKEVVTDLYDNGYSMTDFERAGGAPLNNNGEARVDFYVYELGNNGFGIEPVDLVGNAVAIIQTINGKPVMVRVDTA